jgi:hypothetical protein
MAYVQIKEFVMIQLDPAYAMKDLRGTLVKVKIMSKLYNFNQISNISTITFRCILPWH